MHTQGRYELMLLITSAHILPSDLSLEWFDYNYHFCKSKPNHKFEMESVERLRNRTPIIKLTDFDSFIIHPKCSEGSLCLFYSRTNRSSYRKDDPFCLLYNQIHGIKQNF